MADITIFSSLYGAGFGAIAGSLLAFSFARYSLKSEQRKKLEKIHEILSDEFYRIYVYSNDAKEFITKTLETEKEFDEHFDWVEYEIIRGRSPVIFNLPNFRFLLWDAITSSGSLINLESDEIQLTNSAHNDMILYFKRIEKSIEDFHDKFSMLDKKLELKKKPEKMTKEELQMFLWKIYVDLVSIENIFDKLTTNISWIKKEYSNEKLSDEEQLYDMHHPSFIPVPFPKPEEPIRKTPI